MSEPFDRISKGLELATEGKFSDAEQLILLGIKGYYELKDQDGVTFGLGRLGYCYEQAGQIEKACQAYERAIQYGTDIPATYYNLISILVLAGQFDRAFEVSEIWQRKGAQTISGLAQEEFIELSSSLVRAERYEESIQLLDRTLTYFSRKAFPAQHWKIRGLIGSVYEQQGNIDEAMRLYTEAISEGSTDPLTFNRYLINLEKQKQYQTALTTINKALTIQKDVAWEIELKKRKQRLEKKSGLIPKGTPKVLIPDYSYHGGSRNLELLQQIQFSPQLSHLVVLDDCFYGTTGGKNPKLFCYRLGETDHLWEAHLKADPAGIVAINGHIIAYTRDGRVGDGETNLSFFDTNGRLLVQERLPDVPSAVVAVQDRVYAGCRDGKLYAFSLDGQVLWSYRVPGSDRVFDEAYSRPCPYYIDAGRDIAAFTSFGTLYVITPDGKLLYTWGLPESSETSKTGHFTVTISTGAPPIVAFAVAPVGNKLLAASHGEIYELADGKVIQKLKAKFDSISRIYWMDNDAWGIFDSETFFIIDNGKVKAKIPVKNFSQAAYNSIPNRLVIWHINNLSVLTLSGKLLAEVEFVKSIHSVTCFDDGKILIGTRYALLFDSQPELSQVKEIVSNQHTSLIAKEHKQRPGEESGIPIRWMEAQRLNIGKGKAYYKGSDGNELSIEQLVLDRFRKEGISGQWTENKYWWQIMALLFWDVIFARIPGVYTPQLGDFPGPYQDMPMDFFSPEFYSRRKALIQQRIKELTSSRMFGIVKPSIETELKTIHTRHYGRPCRPIENWERFSLSQLLNATRVLSDQQVIRILHRLLENFNENRRGMPDLFLVDPANKPRFVEVKEEKEKIIEHQLAWLLFLRDQVGLPVEICRVIAT